jgi:tRNA U34 5-methylaminomethyl-2-thiouridine-forming methyltransferase MnmC
VRKDVVAAAVVKLTLHCCDASETLENVANAGQNPLKFPDGFSSSAADLIKRLLTAVRSS